MSKKQQIMEILSVVPDGLTASEIADRAGIEFWRASSWSEPALAELLHDGSVTRRKEPVEGLMLYQIAS